MIYSSFRKRCLKLLIIFVCLSQSGLAQETLTGLYKNEIIENAYKQSLQNQHKATSFIYYEPISIPFIEDFSNYTGYPDTALWIGKQTFVNQSFCVNPPSIGCVTLDALDERGRVYEHASQDVFAADTLLSKPIRLDSIFYPIPRALAVDDSIVFCFFYQPGGGYGEPWAKLGNAPETSDILVLEFGYQTGNIALLHYITQWMYLTDSVDVDDTIFSACDSNLFIIAEQAYSAGDSVEMPCDSVTIMETIWERVWSSNGMNMTTFKDMYGVDFKQVMIPIVDTNYFNRGFQFRFRNYASLEYDNSTLSWSMNVDFWNIDYIRLDRGMRIKDTAINDITIAENPGSMLKRYTAMPWNQFLVSLNNNKSDELRDSFKMKLANLDVDSIGKNATYHYDVFDKGTIIGGYDGQTQNLYPYNISGYQHEKAHASPPVNDGRITFPTYNADSVELLIVHVHREGGGSGDINQKNDTAFFAQKFYNYYAYDDGTPESGYVVYSNISPYNTAMALKFRLNKPDTLRAIDIYINHTLNEVSGFDFNLTVWKDGGGKPGDELYKSLVHQGFSSKLYGFQRFLLDNPITVTDSFYIGYQTSGRQYLNIGFDQNNNNSHNVFYRTNNDWTNSFLFGTPMLRPVLGKYFEHTSICAKPAIDWAIKVYPNPAKDILYIELSPEMQPDNMNISIYSVTGQKIYEGKYTSEISLSNYVSGFYLLQLTDVEQNRNTMRKFLISK